jgi:hypothetical protein
MLIVTGDTTRLIVFLMVDSTDHVTPKTGLSPTVTRSKNGGSFGAVTGAVAEVGGAGLGNGWYKLTPAAGDVDTLGVLVLHATAAGADPADVMVEVVAANVHDATSLGLTRLDATVGSRAAPGAAMTLAANALDASAVDASAVTEIQGGLATSVEIAALNNLSVGDVGTTVQAALTAQGYTTGRAPKLDALDATVSSRSDHSASDVDVAVTASHGAGSYQTAIGFATSGALATTDGKVTDLQSRTPAALVGGRIDASVGAMAGAVVTGAALDSTAGEEIADAIWDEVLSGHVGVGAAGKVLADIAALATTNLDATIGSRAEPGAAMSLVTAAVDAVEAAVVGSTVEDTLTVVQVLRLVLSVLTGQTMITPGSPTVVAFRDLADTKDRISAEMTGSMRTSVTLDPT